MTEEEAVKHSHDLLDGVERRSDDVLAVLGCNVPARHEAGAVGAALVTHHRSDVDSLWWRELVRSEGIIQRSGRVSDACCVANDTTG